MILTEKLYKIILLFIFSLLSVVAFSQTSVLDKKISIQFSRKPLGFVLKSVEKQADVNFVYVSGLFNPNRLISISVKNTTLRNITRKLIQDKAIEFQARGKNIVLSKKEKTSVDKDLSADKLSVIKKFQRGESLKEPVVTHPQALLPPPVTIKEDTSISKIKQDTLASSVAKETPGDTNATSIKAPRIPSVAEWHIGIYGGYNFLSEELSQNKSQYVLFKEVKDAEAMKSVFCGGISFEYKKGNWGIQTGLGITSRKWDVKYNYRVVRPNTSHIIGYNNEPSGLDTRQPATDAGDDDFADNALPVSTPVYKNDTVNINYSNVNTASYLVVPLQLNHYYPVSTHFALQLGFGAELMLLYSSQGMIKVYKNSELEEIDNYLNDCYLRLKVMFGVNYSLTKRNLLSLQAGYGINATNVFKSVYPISRSETAASIALSYVWVF